MHGFALNVNCDLNMFSLINPCGLGEVEITSLKNEGADAAVENLLSPALEIFSELLNEPLELISRREIYSLLLNTPISGQ